MDASARIEKLVRESVSAILTPLGFAYELEYSWLGKEAGCAIMLSTPDARYLIGEKGDKLDDLQYLVNRLVQAQWDDAPRVRVDCDHHRERAEATLLRRAHSRAARVLQSGSPLQMEKLNAYQRRLVHNALAEIEGIETISEETDSRFKRITIRRTF